MQCELEKVTPYDSGRPKGEQVGEMFDSIATVYDRMNALMTFGSHRRWLRQAIRHLEKGAQAEGPEPKDIIDLATGTGDVAFAMAARHPQAAVTGADLSEKMLEVARSKQTPSQHITFISADCMALPMDDASFDTLTIAYGVRNFENLDSGFREFYRILRKGGSAMILELSRPENPVIRLGYDIYTHTLIPLMAKISRGDSRAYSYLPESIKAMPPRRRIAEMLREAGFKTVETYPMTMGVVTCYIAKK